MAWNVCAGTDYRSVFADRHPVWTTRVMDVAADACGVLRHPRPAPGTPPGHLHSVTRPDGLHRDLRKITGR